MSGTMRLTDDAIRLALTPAADVHAPAGLADGIRSGVAATSQRRRSILGWAPSRRTRLALRLVVVGLLLLALVGVLLLVGSRRPPGVPPSTSTYHGGPERNGVMPGPAPSGDPVIAWQKEVPGSIGPWSPAVVDGVVYVADQNGSVTAFDEADGMQLWARPLGATINGGITIASGVLIVGDDAGMIHGLDIAARGADKWPPFDAGKAIHTAPAVVDGVAYIGTADGHLYALDVLTGAPHWPGPVITAGPIGRSVAASGGFIFVGSGGATPSDRGTLQAYDTTGMQRWAQPLEPGDTSTPSVSDGRVFVTGGLDGTATAQHDLYAFDAATGDQAWPPFHAPTGKILLIGAVADGLVFAESDDGSMYVLDAGTGSLKWFAPIHSSQSPSAGVVGGTIYVTSDDRKIHAFDIGSHRELGGSWPFVVLGVPGTPAIVDGRIFVGTSEGEVISITGSAPPPGSGATP